MARPLASPPGPPTGGGASEDEIRLPDLRPELRLHGNAPTGVGAQTFVVEDPIRHRFIQVDGLTCDLLALMSNVRKVSELQTAANTRLAAWVDREEIIGLVEFLFAHDLTVEPATGAWRNLLRKQERGQAKPFKRLIHNYLFFRLPIARPQTFLEATLFTVDWAYSRLFMIITMCAAIVGLYLVSRQWDTFLSSALYIVTLEGAILFSVALLVVKIIHELAHAYTAVRFGCRVPTVGVAFMLLIPLLYTDVTDAWRLKRRSQRLAVDSAGVLAELAVASYATLLWVFLPDGALKSTMFMLATAGWLMSLAFNLNPFMRFDGYYILSDIVGIDNLQPRSFQIAKWYLREVLFSLRDQPPEQFSSSILLRMALYGYAVWIYRLVLFVGIAILIYVSTFKVLGIFLFVVEIVFPVLWPISKELVEWWKMRRRILQSARTLSTISVTVLVGLVFFVPWSGTVIAPAVVSFKKQQPVHPLAAAQIVSVHATPGADVQKGDILFRLSRPELGQQLRVAMERLRSVEIRLGRGASDQQERGETLVLIRERARLLEEIAGLNKAIGDLELRAPMSGRVLQVATDLKAGRWVGTETMLALVGAVGALEARGYVTDDDVGRVHVGISGHFISDNPLLHRVHVTLQQISPSGVSEIDLVPLTSTFGGPVAVEPDDQNRLVPARGQYRIVADVQSDSATTLYRRELTGVIHLNGVRQSFAARFWRRFLQVVAQEAGA